MLYERNYNERLHNWLRKKGFGSKKRANTVSLATNVIAQKQETRKLNLFIHNKRFKPKNQGEFKIMNQIEQKLDSREVAGMVGKRHKNLLSDIRGYVEELNELKIQPVDFFRETVYKDAKGQERPCYDITKKGCEFIAHKLTGIKGTEFTARYINRFHDMEDVIREEIPKKQDKPKKEKLPSVNMMVKNIKEALHDAGVDSKYIAAEVVRIYSDSGYPVNAPLISDTPKLWDCTTIAKELGIFSETGRPHDKAVSAIIQKLDLFTDEIVRTAYSRNGHDGVTMQYKESVFQKVKEWLQENGYPTVIELELANGNVNKCRVVYGEVA